MWPAPSRLQLLFALGLAMAAAGFGLILIPDSDVDLYFQARTGKASYSGRGRPVVLIDEAHANEYTVEGRFQPLARLLREDGYITGANLRLFTEDSLRGVAVLVIANARAWLGESAFSRGEIQAVRGWVDSGGSLLLAVDPGPRVGASRALATAFGVGLGDSVHGEEMLLRRSDGFVVGHAVTGGALRSDQVMCFGCQSMTGPGEVFLKLPNGGTLGMAMEVGKGRVVVLGNAVMITALRRGQTAVGFNRGGNDNARLTLNLLHWLSRL